MFKEKWGNLTSLNTIYYEKHIFVIFSIRFTEFAQRTYKGVGTGLLTFRVRNMITAFFLQNTMICKSFYLDTIRRRHQGVIHKLCGHGRGEGDLRNVHPRFLLQNPY